MFHLAHLATNQPFAVASVSHRDEICRILPLCLLWRDDGTGGCPANKPRKRRVAEDRNARYLILDEHGLPQLHLTRFPGPTSDALICWFLGKKLKRFRKEDAAIMFRVVSNDPTAMSSSRLRQPQSAPETEMCGLHGSAIYTAPACVTPSRILMCFDICDTSTR